MIRLLAAGLAALALAGIGRCRDPPRQADLEAEIVCPTCKTTLDQSSSPIATRMKSYIRARIAAGDSAAQIKAQLVDQFGPAVLAEPPKRGFDLLAWLLPLAALGLGDRRRRRACVDVEPPARQRCRPAGAPSSTPISSAGWTRSSPGTRTDR